ncbi:fatty acyl-AMP ligase [Flavihumibacter profundi]|uniref:fatty acyl-AMP ligase n=1 Tax=Flavihumibacter profundi TaxID=2716883 RepID=UPI001CC802E2|nr:fatty acyl-AMP ligase [Flavihumibacter profundi]MBZ5859382.1 fatty acyl-AMP ligase [Flavihumibacter profundi]
MTHLPTSLVDILRLRANNQPNRLAYRYLADGEYDEVVLTYEDLDRRARSIGALLQSSTRAGDRALLLFAPGLDFVAAYFGCLYAKIIAIPAYPPHPARMERMLPIILGIVDDAAPAVVLLNSALFDVINSQKAVKAGFGNMKLLVTDNNEIDNWAEKWQKPEIEGNDIAFLQYTSGSTTTPKGVMVSHSNLLHNLGLIEKYFGQSSESHAVIWLPPYHDMGLVGGILQPLYTGYPATLIPHMMFLQRPYRWLQAISRFRATTSGGPNFAYDLCMKKIKPEQRELLDLSCWEVAFNGAEQVYHKSLDQFADYFAPCGFRREAFLPCYGLAEATLMVMGGPKGRSPVIQNLMSSGLEQNQVIISPTRREDTRTLVSCGQNGSDQKIRIVDTGTLTLCPADQVGEIWVSGPSVAHGYWNKPSETELTFGARLSNSGEGPFLRTGDLGFLHEGELFITGRLKDLIISDGNNHYPNDIERTVESSHPAIRQAGSAAFSINNSEGERIIIIAEIEQNPDVKAEEIIMAIRKAVAVHHDLHVDDIRLTRPGGIPKTASGKIKHYLCKTNYLAGTLNEIILT